MSKDRVLGRTEATLLSGDRPSYAEESSRSWPAPAGSPGSQHYPLFRAVWLVVNGMLALAVLFAILAFPAHVAGDAPVPRPIARNDSTLRAQSSTEVKY